MTDKMRKYFKIGFIVWISIFCLGLVRTTFQNDTFYTIKIGDWIIHHGIDMLDHFSFHNMLPYTYPHWLYDTFIYLIYHYFGYTGIYISSIILFIILLIIVFKVDRVLCKNITIAAFATLICALALSGFVTARAQLVSYIIFALEILFIENYLNKGKIKYLIGLLILSVFLCNIHGAVWPFYYIIYLPYLAEHIIALICGKIKKENKLTKYLKNHITIERHQNIKYLFLTMIISLLTGLMTPIKDTAYMYTIRIMMGNSQKYISEHQMITWKDSPFTIIIAIETIIMIFISKIKLRDLFMVSGLVLMAVISIRHISFLTLIGTMCFARTFDTFISEYVSEPDKIICNFLKKKHILVTVYLFIIVFCAFMLKYNLNKPFIDEKLYPVKATKFIKDNLDLENIHLFNEYNYGSYLLLNDIPVFIDSRCDLYTKPFNKLDYDIFDDYHNLMLDWEGTFDFYQITHVILNKNDSVFHELLKTRHDYEVIYEDKNFIIFKRANDYVVHYEN